MNVLDYLVNSLITVILIVGSYQFYFFLQRRHVGKPIEFRSRVDELIPFRPSWIWVYITLYYPVIVLGVLTIGSFAQFNYTAFSFIMLLAMHLLAFFIFPVRTPAAWREYKLEQSLSTRLLGLVQRYDAPSNSFPSLHVSVATLTALHLYNNLNPFAGQYAVLVFLFPVLIAISSVCTKQHYFADVPTGAILGYANYKLFEFYW
jgi:membrane-associated phospholipid phosphatase